MDGFKRIQVAIMSVAALDHCSNSLGRFGLTLFTSTFSILAKMPLELEQLSSMLGPKSGKFPIYKSL